MSERNTTQNSSEDEKEYTKTEKGISKPCIIWVYTFIDLMAPIGQRLQVFGFESEQEALDADKNWEFTTNKTKEIADRKLSPVMFKHGWGEFFLFRKRLLKRAKKTDKKSKKAFDKARQKERDERRVLPLQQQSTTTNL